MKKYLLIICGVTIVVLTAIFFYTNGLFHPTDIDIISDSDYTAKTESNDESINLSADLAISPNQQTTSNDLDLIYTPNDNQDVSAITLRLILELNPKNLINTLRPFVLDTKLEEIGFTDHINKFSCSEPSACQLEIALIKLSPDKWNLDKNTRLGSITFDKDFDTSNLHIQIDQTETKALTPAGESITINLQK